MTTRLFRIPLEPTPQSFYIELEGRVLGIVCRWNDADEGGWFIDIAENELPLVMNIPLVTGINLLEQYPDLGFTGVLAVQSEGADMPPTLENLGSASNLYYLAVG